MFDAQQESAVLEPSRVCKSKQADVKVKECLNCEFTQATVMNKLPRSTSGLPRLDRKGTWIWGEAMASMTIRPAIVTLCPDVEQIGKAYDT